MVNNLRRRVANHLPCRHRILVEFDAVQPSGFPGFRHNAALNDMQRVQLDAVHAGFNHLFQRFKAMLLTFPGQPDNQMGTDLQPALARKARSALVAGKIMSTVDTVQRFIMRGL